MPKYLLSQKTFLDLFLETFFRETFLLDVYKKVSNFFDIETSLALIKFTQAS